jgi:tRNA threonylcarbamoyladenosine biosynthesis protein TsaB
MKILALEFSSPQRSAALVQRSHSPAEIVEYEAVESGAHSNKPFEMIEEVLRQSGIEREQVERLAIGLGPGSYAGIRGSIALAQGWQLGGETPIQGVSSAECVAAQAHAEGVTGGIAVVIDAQRGEFYLARYELTSGAWREVEPLRLASAAKVSEREQHGDLLVGPEVQNWFPKGRTIFPRAATLGRLALDQTSFISGEDLQPIYLRTPNFVKAPPPRILLE